MSRRETSTREAPQSDDAAYSISLHIIRRYANREEEVMIAGLYAGGCDPHGGVHSQSTAYLCFSQ